MIGLRDRIPDHSTLQKAADRLLARTVEVARTRALIPPKPRAAIDATGLESRHARRSKRVYGQRWQVESGFSRLKRLLGSALRARRWIAQEREIVLRVVTHNLMLLAA